jgi:DNA invertase Pin-like site-specific DNA recombinase
MTTFIYTRVSTVQQVSGMSADAQVATCKSYLDLLKNKGEWVKGDLHILNEQVSGSVAFSRRTRGGELLAKIQKGDLLVIAKLDRAWRSANDALACIEDFKKRGVSLHLVDMGGDVCDGISQLVVTIMSAVAQWERERIGERTREAKREQVRQGLYAGGKVPWDKRIVGGKLVDDAKKVAVVAKLRTWRSEGVTLRDCQKRVKKLGLTVSTEAIRRLSDDVRNAAATCRGRRKP